MSYLFSILMSLTAVFLILLVLVQRGRGGGLAGAFGGMGGQSAFGTKAGDLFTRITMVTATFWILLCVAGIAVLNSQRSVFGTVPTGSTDATLEGAMSEGGVSPDAASQPGEQGAASAPDSTDSGEGDADR